MNDKQIFLLTEVKGDNKIANVGNFCFTPIRYLFNGRTIKIVPKDPLPKVLNVPSFHKKSFLKTVAAIILLIPGLLIGSIFKGLSYLSQSIREQHRIVKQFYAPTTIGSPENPLDEAQVIEALKEIKKNRLQRKIKALVVYGRNLEFNLDPGFVELNPKKLIFVGADIVHKSAKNRLDEKLARTRKWLCRDPKPVGSPFVIQFGVKSVDEALNHQLPLRPGSSKRYHAAYVVVK